MRLADAKNIFQLKGRLLTGQLVLVPRFAGAIPQFGGSTQNAKDGSICGAIQQSPANSELAGMSVAPQAAACS